MNLANIIIKPVVTEKSSVLMGKNKYVFAVAKKATKGQIREAVKSYFGVEPKTIRTITVKEKSQKRRYGPLVKGKVWKKAIVELKEGEKIDLFGSQEEGQKK